MTENVDRLRSLTVGASSKFAKQIVEFQGGEFEIRQPSIGLRSSIREKCTVRVKDEIVFNLFEFLVWHVIHCTYLPGSDEKIFTEEDYDVLIGKPTGGFMDKFAEVIADMVNIETSEVKKPSGETQSDS